jgi:ABC-type branched-subunit amino acid transport system substrate-binding protein
MMRRVAGCAALLVIFGAAAGCKKDEPTSGTPSGEADRAGALKVDKGVDLAKKVIYIGALNDESGPAASIGKSYAVGKRILAAAVNAGDSGLLPEGWRVELVERDHGYNPQQSVQQYNAIKDKVLFIATSFGTPNTLPLLDMLGRDGLVAFPASLSSEMQKNERTPPLAASYKVEAMRAMDWVVEQAGGADKVLAGIVYQHDDYGKDGHDGWKQAAEHHGVKIVSAQTVAPGQQDVTAAVAALKDAGATHVLLTTLPSATGPILGTAAQLRYMPVWIGNTPAWIDRFFNPEVIPAAVFGNFYWVVSVPYWGEQVPGMDKVLAAFEKHGKAMGEPDFYVVGSYIQGLIQLEAARRAIESNDLTRAGFLRALRTIDNWDAGGLIQPISLAKHPYETSTEVRVLKPDLAGKAWSEVSGYASPAAMK